MAWIIWQVCGPISPPNDAGAPRSIRRLSGVWVACGQSGSNTGRGDIAAGMDGHGFRLAFVEDLDHVLGGPDAHFLVDQRVRDGVEVLLELDVVVDVHPGGLRGRIFKGLFWQRTQGGLIQFFEQLLPGFVQVLHGAMVQLFQQLQDRPVQFGQAEEGAVAQSGQDPALHHLHAHFDLGLVAGRRTRAGMTATP